jgi:hypothetical protein
MDFIILEENTYFEKAKRTKQFIYVWQSGLIVGGGIIEYYDDDSVTIKEESYSRTRSLFTYTIESIT